MQNLENAHRDDIRSLNQIVVPAGSGRTSFIDGRDIAAIAAKILQETVAIHDRKAYVNIGLSMIDSIRNVTQIASYPSLDTI